MNRDELERLALLAESGELGAEERQALERKLDALPEAAAWRADAKRLTAVAHQALPTGDPSPATLARIRDAAHARATRPVPLHFSAVWMQGLAYAAALALAVGAWLGRGTEGQIDSIAQMHAIVVMTSNETATTPTVPAETEDADTRLRALAQELLALEGLALDESTSEILPGEERPDESDHAPRADGSAASGRWVYSTRLALSQSSSMA